MRLISLSLALALTPSLIFAQEQSPKQTPAPTPALDPAVLPYSLNVLYFVPADMQPVEGYQKRISDIMFSIQKFMGKEMARNGFPNRTFGLRTTNNGNSVNIVTIKGKKDKSAYTYERGYPAVLKEVNEFFEQNPQLKFSQHSLIIMPSISGKDMEPGGVPFYGVGKNCFALDYPHFDLKYIGEKSPKGKLFTKWYGGMAHELGHGLNLPHNRESNSEQKTLGTALMGAGNYTLGQTPTFLTKASCAILDQSQTFRTQALPEKTAPQITRLPFSIKFKPDSVNISGKMPEGHRIKHIITYYDKDIYGGVNDDYDAEAFVAKINPDQSWEVTIPLSEIRPGNSKKYQIRFRVINDDGSCNIIRENFILGEEKDLSRNW